MKELCSLLLILFSVVLSQNPDQIQMIKQQERSIRLSYGMAYQQNPQSYSFVLNNLNEFYIYSTEKQEIKGDMIAFWKINRTYVPSTYQYGEDIRLIVYDFVTSQMLYDRIFYMETGFSFNAQKDKQYLIRIINNGNHPKILEVAIQKILPKYLGIVDSSEIRNFHRRTQALVSSLNVRPILSRDYCKPHRGIVYSPIKQFNLYLHQQKHIDILKYWRVW